MADFLDGIVREAKEARDAAFLDGSLPSLGNYWQRIEHMRPQLMGLARNEHERTLVRRAVDAVVRYLKEGVFEDPALGHSVMMAMHRLRQGPYDPGSPEPEP